MFNFTAPPPLSLYIHIPWCARKCPYCDFNSHEARGEIPERAYVEALIADLEQDLETVSERPVESVFIGGGTPSLFTPAAVCRLLTGIGTRLPLREGAEITLEANPGTVDRERLLRFREAGVNRLSIGVQSFQDALLEGIGRVHSGREAAAAVEAARDAGFDNINLDLMFGLPGQFPAGAVSDLETAMALQPEHLSWYELTIEAGTPFYRHPPARPAEDVLRDIQQAGSALLRSNAYTRYEVSAWVREDRHCRHNLNYWHFGDYLGIGAGAHGKITDVALRTITRRIKTRHPRRYLDTAHTAARISTITELTPADAVLEYAMNALRLDAGFTATAFTAATGLPITAAAEAIRSATDRQLLEHSGDVFRATDRGRLYLDELLQFWLPAGAVSC
ncbi:MAG: radical SAM family heme chaperone HemW [Gammaproteobacteria bacterium]|jgi:oxygen-independent coproporphyrinogen-3 oxidase